MKTSKSLVSLENEQILISMAQTGDNKAFDALLAHYRFYVSRYLMTLIADPDAVEDIVQDTYIKIFKSIHQFRGEGTFKSWLCTIARNTWKNYLRREHFERFDSNFDVYSDELATELSVEDEVCEEQENEQLQKVIRLLPEKQRLVVCMRVNEQLPFSEIAHRMCRSVSTVKTNHYYGVKNIQILFAA